MRRLGLLSIAALILAGCTAVSQLEGVKRGEGRNVLYDATPQRLCELAQSAFMACGLVVTRVNYKSERIEVLGYMPEEFGEHGSIYGLYIYPLGAAESDVYVVMKPRYPTEIFSRDASDDLIKKLDELVLKDRATSSAG